MWRIGILLGLVRCNEVVPGIYGLGCATVGDKQYAVGGALQASEAKLNHLMYQLDLSQLSDPSWELMPAKLYQDALYPYIIQPSGTAKFTLVGGKKALASTNFLSFDSKSLSWQSNNASKLYRPTTNALLNSYPFAGGLVQSDVSSSEYILWGGVVQANDFSSQEFIPLTWSLNTDSGNWTQLDIKLSPTWYFSSTNVYKGGMFVVGGMTAKEDKVVSLDSIFRFDFVNRTWTELACSGANSGSRSHHSTVVVGNLLYLIGGHNITPVSDRVDVLNLDTLVWSTHYVPGLQGKTQGCLTYHQNKLVYSFGFGDPFDSRVQVIDTNNWSITKSSIPIPLGIILGGSIGGSLGGLALVLLCLYFYQRYQRIKNTNEIYQKQYQDQMRVYNELNRSRLIESNLHLPIEINLDLPKEPDLTFLSNDPSNLCLPPNLTQLDHNQLSNFFKNNVEIPKEWHKTDHI